MSALTRPQREALAMIRRADPGEVYLGATETWEESGGGVLGRAPWRQAWIHWRTARALQRRGLIRIEGYGEDAVIYLTERDEPSQKAEPTSDAPAQSPPSSTSAGGCAP